MKLGKVEFDDGVIGWQPFDLRDGPFGIMLAVVIDILCNLFSLDVKTEILENFWHLKAFHNI